MASSLLFKISTIFSGAGFRAAGEGLGRLLRLTAPLILSLTKLGVRFGILQTIIGVVFGRALIRGIQGTIAEATRAETAFSRLGVQLNLLGQGSRKNIGEVTKFAKESAGATRFAARETQEAVTIALRRTGDVATALKQVAVAQDIAAATGKDLRRTTLLLNIAQAGNTRILRQITNLSKEQIATALRQGRLLDVLAEKFGGAASTEAQTLAGRISVLKNQQELLNEEFGKIGIPISKFVTNIRILGAGLTRFAVREGTVAASAIGDLASRFTFLGRLVEASGSGFDQLRRKLSEISPAFRNAFGDAASSIRDNVRAVTTGIVDIDKELELRFLRAGKTRAEIRTINREVSRVQQDLLQAERSGVRSLKQIQIERIKDFKFSQRELISGERGRIENERDRNIVRQRELAAQRSRTPLGGAAALAARIRESGQELANLTQNGFTFSRSLDEIQSSIRSLAESQVAAGGLTEGQADRTLSQVDRILAGVTTVEQATRRLTTFGGPLAALLDSGTLIKDAIEQFRPIFEPTVTLSISQEQIKTSVQSGVAGAIAGLFASLRRQITEAASTSRAQEDFSGG